LGGNPQCPNDESGLALGRHVGRDQPGMFGKPRQGDLQNDLPGARRPAICLLGLLETFQLAANIDQDS
jgi:hypothetical protein